MLSQETENKSSFYFIIQHVHWLDSKRKPEKLGLDKCENHLFWNSPACLIHDNTSTLPLLVFDYRWNTCTRYQLMLCFDEHLLMKKFSTFFSNFNHVEALWKAQIRNLRFQYSPCWKLKREAWVKFKISQFVTSFTP